MKYILTFYLCLLIPGGHKFNQYPAPNNTLPGTNTFKSWWLQKTKKETLRDEALLVRFQQCVGNSIRFIKIGLWD